MRKAIGISIILLSFGVVHAQDSDRIACETDFFSTCKKKPTFGESAQEITDYMVQQVDLSNQQGFKRGLFEVNMNCTGEIYQVRQLNEGFADTESVQIKKALLEMPKWNAASRENPINYQFFIEVKWKDDKMTVNTFMR